MLPSSSSSSSSYSSSSFLLCLCFFFFSFFLTSSCPPVGLGLSFCCCPTWPRFPVSPFSSRPPVVLFLSFLRPSTPLVLLVHLVRSQLLLLLSSWCVRVVFLSLSFCPRYPPHVLLWSVGCPAAVILSTLLSKAGPRARLPHHHHNNNTSHCRQSCLVSMLE